MTGAKQRVVWSRQQASALLEYLPGCQQQGFVAGRWQTREGDAPWFTYDTEVVSFVQAVYDHDLLLSFDWPKWSAQAEEYMRRPDRVRSADLIQLRKLLTALVRGERFVEGLMALAFDRGLIVAPLERMHEVLDTT